MPLVVCKAQHSLCRNALERQINPTPWWLWGSGSTAVIGAEVQVGFEVAVSVSLLLSFPRRAC